METINAAEENILKVYREIDPRRKFIVETLIDVLEKQHQEEKLNDLEIIDFKKVE